MSLRTVNNLLNILFFTLLPTAPLPLAHNVPAAWRSWGGQLHTIRTNTDGGAVGKAVGWLFKIVKMVVSLRRKS